MHVLLIYDIESDGRRTKIADACLDYGLDRIQYSAFTGELSRTHQEELMLKIGALLGDTYGKIALFPIDEKAWGRRLSVEVTRDEATMEVQDGLPLTAD